MPQISGSTDATQSTPTDRFLRALGGRLEALEEGLVALKKRGQWAPLQRQLERRLQAMADASAALGLEQLNAAFTSAEANLASATGLDGTRAAADSALRILELIPQLIEPTPASVEPAAKTDKPASAPESEPRQREPESKAASQQAPAPSVTPPTPASARPDVVMLGAMPLRRVAKHCEQALPQMNIHFTIDLDDALSLARSCARPAIVLDARRADAGHDFHALSDIGPCILVEATSKQCKAFDAQGAHASLEGSSALCAELESLFAGGAPHKDTPVAPARPQSHETPAAAEPPHAVTASHRESGAGKRNPKADVIHLPDRTILLADSDPATAWFLSGVLKSARATVLEARDGTEALQLAQERRPDLVISDVALSGLDGYGLCRNLKRDVVLGDVPVILVAWKEQHLQRVRELGAGADGYFVKEADSATVLRRCSEVLLPRANVETRLRDEGRVVGRLEGMTTWSVLRMACDVVGNARVTFSDAGYQYVVAIGDGRLLSATRDAGTGELDKGAQVLPGLLGMRAGRFIIEPWGETVQATFFGSMSAALAPHVARVRNAVSVLQGKGLHRVARLELDEVVFRPYADASPPIVRKAIEKLTDGVPPFALGRSVSAGLLESVLTDLALRGAVTAAFDMDGIDLLSTDVSAQPFDLELTTPTAGFDLMSAVGAPVVTRSSDAQDAQAAAAFAAAPQVAAPDERRAGDADDEPALLASPAPTATSQTPIPKPDPLDGEAHWSADLDVPEIPAAPVEAHEAQPVVPPEPTDAEPAEAPLAHAAAAPDTPPKHAAPAGHAATAEPDPPADSVAPMEPEAAEAGAPPATTSDERRPSRAPMRIEFANTDADAPLQLDISPAQSDAAPLPERASPAADASLQEPAADASLQEPRASAAPDDEELDLADALVGSLAATPAPEPSAPPKKTNAHKSATSDEETHDSELLVSSRLGSGHDENYEEEDPLFAALHAESEPPYSVHKDAEPKLADQTTTPKKVDLQPATDALRNRAAELSSLARKASERAVQWARQCAQEVNKRRANSQAPAPAPEAEKAAAPDAAAPEQAAPEASSQLPPSMSEKAPPKPAASVDASATEQPPDALLAETPDDAARGQRLATIGKRTVLPALAVLGAAGLAFSGMGAIVERVQATQAAQAEIAALAEGPLGDRHDSEASSAEVRSDPSPARDDIADVDPEPAPVQEDEETSAALKNLAAAQAANGDTDVAPPDSDVSPPESDVAPPSQRRSSPQLELSTRDIPLPDDVKVSAGRGLLEINTADGHKIYVDGVFIGRGPVRRVPLDAGQHRVELRLDGDVSTLDVQVIADKRLRIEPATHAALTQ